MDPWRKMEKMSPATEARWASKRKSKSEQYISGPIPVPWIVAAGTLPGRAVQVALALWYRHRLDRGGPTVLSRTLLKQFAIGRTTAWRGLRALETAGLVEVDRQRGRAPRVVILPYAK